MPEFTPEYDVVVTPQDFSNASNTCDIEAPEDFDRPRCHCGVVGIFNHPEASVMAYYALHSLQHRGQEAAGILVARKEKTGSGSSNRFFIHKDNGLVLEIFKDSKILTETLRGEQAIAHNRYSTTGATGKVENIQ